MENALNASCPRIVIAGTGSGVGKTSLALSLVRALSRRGLKVQPFKVGPDFLDPTYLTLAAKRTCYNLDSWMTSRDYVRDLFARKIADADIAVIEGAMGLFDGFSPTSLEASTAEIALCLETPVLLTVNAHGTAGSIAPLVKGFAEFHKDVNVRGVVANRCGSDRHKEILQQALQHSGCPPLVGSIPEDAFPALPSRHLGLVTADQEFLNVDLLDKLAEACTRNVDLDAILSIAKSASRLEVSSSPLVQKGAAIRLGIARDEAFHFYYPDNLEVLEQLGAELVCFSPIHDSALPDNLCGIYLGGGYPEEFAQLLSSNTNMIQSIRSFAATGRPIYAECGGLMYLGEKVVDRSGLSFSLSGLLPLNFVMQNKLKSLGYVEVTLMQDSLWGQSGQSLRGHEFHYSDVCEPKSDSFDFERNYSLKSRSGKVRLEGYRKGNILAGYPHLHFASKPAVANYFINFCRETDHES
jgi:cobyrinic acid a,c-diamide synthase